MTENGEGFMKVYSYFFASMTLFLLSCGKQDSKENEGPDAKTYVSDLKINKLLSYEEQESNSASELLLLEDPQSPAACKLYEYKKSLTSKMLSDLPEKFCDNSEIKIDTKYSLTMGSYNYKYFFKKVGEQKYVATYCNTNGTKTVSTIETSGDGKGKVTQRYDSEAIFANGDEGRSNFKDTFQKYYDGSDDISFSGSFYLKREDKKDDYTYSEIRFNADGGKWIQSINKVSKISIADDPDFRSYFNRKVVLFDSEHGHELHNYGYPDDSDQANQDISNHEYFTAGGIAVKSNSSEKFGQDGSLFVDETRLPQLVEKEEDLEIVDDDDAWDCEGVNLEKTLVCEEKIASDDSGSNDCNFSSPDLD
jgi:hypothetical protein